MIRVYQFYRGQLYVGTLLSCQNIGEENYFDFNLGGIVRWDNAFRNEFSTNFSLSWEEAYYKEKVGLKSELSKVKKQLMVINNIKEFKVDIDNNIIDFDNAKLFWEKKEKQFRRALQHMKTLKHEKENGIRNT